MKCEKCNNEYPSEAYFKAQGLCENCYQQMTPEEKQQVDAHLYYHNQYYMQYGIQERRVGFGMRLGAAVIDGIIMYIITGIIYYFSGYSQELYGYLSSADFQNITSLLDQVAEISNKYFTTILFSQLISLFYYSLEIVLGASLGKLILGIQIADMNGAYADKSQLLLRYLYKHSGAIISLIALIPFLGLLGMFSGLIGFLIFIGCFFVLGQKRQAFHDMWAGTAVFRKTDLQQINANNSLQN